MSAEALEVLRQIWRSQGQTAADLDDGGQGKSCKRMTDAGVGFDDFADGKDGRDLRAAWRNRLEREGKLNQSGGSVRDLILGPAGATGTAGATGATGATGAAEPANGATRPAGPAEHV